MKSPLSKFTLLFSLFALLIAWPGSSHATHTPGGETGKVLKKSNSSFQLTVDNLYTAMTGDNLGNHNATTRLNMSTYSIDMGTGCRYAQIKTISNAELSFGFWNGCIGPPSYSAIMTLEYSGVNTGNVGIG